MFPPFLILLLERLVIKKGFQSWWIIILARAQIASLLPSYKVDGWPLVDITLGPSPGPCFGGCLGKQSLCYSQWCHKEGPCSRVSISLQKWAASFEFVHIKLPPLFQKREEVLPYLWRNQKHVLFTGPIFHELVHLVHSCQNRVKKGQRINVRESASLHKSPSPSRASPSWPSGPSNLWHEPTGIRTMWKSKDLFCLNPNP